MNNSVLYLETFVDGTAFLPPDLQRQLNTLKALDEKSLEMSETVHQNVAQLMNMPPQHQHGPTEEFLELSRKVEQDQRLLLQFAEEKVQVAQQVRHACMHARVRAMRACHASPCMGASAHAWECGAHAWGAVACTHGASMQGLPGSCAALPHSTGFLSLLTR